VTPFEIGVYIAGQSSLATAARFVARIEAAIRSLADAPHRGTLHDEIRPGLRTFGVERRATILFLVEEDSARVVILGVLYGGRDIRKALRARPTKP
jgi:plasmid stabilization system protein ParE